ncbi:putative helicase MAGATAMA 3 [Dendrobium catenatum]|uniref:Putative helicase MAGATAMA 3 n=1 Tax=Dendrobium catenatum TaxID=906689 RepID=A0A2I0X3E1_9ASPA|nr:putative helicase MAGATAMA 3 [Dendrobium catenatum]
MVDFIFQICSLSTIMREYTAMHSIAHLPFKDLILSASHKSYCSVSEGQAWNVPKPLMDHLEDCLNSSQLDAINAGLLRKPFVLIQEQEKPIQLLDFLAPFSIHLLQAYTRMVELLVSSRGQ